MPARPFFSSLVLIALAIASPFIARADEVEETHGFKSPHADYFRSFDSDNDGLLSGEEGMQLPMVMQTAFYGEDKDGGVSINVNDKPVSLKQFHEFLEDLHREQKKEFDRQQFFDRARESERQLQRYLKSLLPIPPSERGRGRTTTRIAEHVTLEESPHAEYFRHFDEDDNGVLDSNEQATLPGHLIAAFQHMFPAAWSANQITIREFHTYWENLKRERSAAKRRSNEDRRYAEYRAKLFSSDEVDPQVTKKPESEEAAAVANAPADTATEATTNDKAAVPDSCTVDIVLIRRAQEDLPERTLAEEVMSMLKEPGPPLSAKLLPWLADKSNQQVELFDYIQAKSIAGKQITIQRGGREAYPSSISQMGGGRSTTSYSFHNVGTLVSVNASDFVEGKLELEITFEKSYVDAVTEDKEPADKEVAESPEAATSTEEAAETSSPKTREEMLNELRDRQRSSASRVVASTAPTPPSIETITAEGKLRLEPQSPAVLTEIARKKGDQLEEIVVLVEWR